MLCRVARGRLLSCGPSLRRAARLSTTGGIIGDDAPSEPAPESGLAVPRTVSVIGAPVSFGQALEGVDGGPSIIREQGLGSAITELGWRLDDRGDVEPVRPSANDPASPKAGKARHTYAVGKSCEALASAVRGAASEGRFALTLGGDHSVAVGTVAGVLGARPDAGIVWVDAHADINTPASSPSGNVHGMPVAFLMDLVERDSIPGYDWLNDAAPPLAASSIVYIGLRQVDAGERALLKKLGVLAFDMHAIDRLGIGAVMDRTLEHLCAEAARPLHLSFDIDACDPSVAASTGTAVRGGLDYRESHYICEELARTGLLSSMDMVEVNPRLAADEATRTASMAVELIASALGRTVL